MNTSPRVRESRRRRRAILSDPHFCGQPSAGTGTACQQLLHGLINLPHSAEKCIRHLALSLRDGIFGVRVERIQKSRELSRKKGRRRRWWWVLLGAQGTAKNGGQVVKELLINPAQCDPIQWRETEYSKASQVLRNIYFFAIPIGDGSAVRRVQVPVTPGRMRNLQAPGVTQPRAV